MKNLAGMKYNRLTPIFPDINKSHGNITYWVCKCDCGAVKSVRSDHLKSGRIKSCGCLSKEQASIKGKKMSKKISGWNFKDLKGYKIGRLTVIDIDIHGDNTHPIYWKCVCECGAELSVPATNLIRKHTTSCGCSMSKGEQKIGEILKANNIPFTKNKTFNDCRFANGALAKFDFFIDNSYVLEFDGLQHLQDGIFGNSISSVENYRQRDEFKNKWCKDNGIVLIRIPYQERNNLTIKDLLPESSDFIVR